MASTSWKRLIGHKLNSCEDDGEAGTVLALIANVQSRPEDRVGWLHERRSTLLGPLPKGDYRIEKQYRDAVDIEHRLDIPSCWYRRPGSPCGNQPNRLCIFGILSPGPGCVGFN